MNLKSIIKKIILCLVIFLFCILLISLRFFISAKTEWEIAQDYLKNGKLEPAIVHLDMTIRNYFLFSPYVKKSSAILFNLASDFEKEKKYQESFNTYQTLLSAFYSIKNPLFFPPIKYSIIEDNLKKVKDKISLEDKN